MSIALKKTHKKTVPKVPKATNAPYGECSIEDNLGTVASFGGITEDWEL